MGRYRIGVDLGGTKTEVAALAPDGRLVLRRRVPTPSGYDAALAMIEGLVRETEAELSVIATVGIGIPGAISPATGLVKTASSNALNGHAFDRDISALLEREVRVQNDANCFALSEAADGAGTGRDVVFGVILGTGCGGGIVVGGKVLEGRHRICGEWGHNPLPWPLPDEVPGPQCWCGRYGCLETMVSGPGLARHCDGPDACDATAIPARAERGEERARTALQRHGDRLARGLAQVINLLDPDAIVLGGGLSNMEHLYARVPELLRRYVVNDRCTTPVLKNRHGDSSGVRGAAWLWPAAG